jgi:hypothetical protein
MRHFLIEELVPLALAVAGLPSSVQTLGAPLDPVGCACAPQRLPTPGRSTVTAEPLATVTPAAEPKLNPTSLAEREPILRNRHETPGRRFLDTEPGVW